MGHPRPESGQAPDRLGTHGLHRTQEVVRSPVPEQEDLGPPAEAALDKGGNSSTKRV